jgi:predicted nuclease with TOPRIM domain
MATIPQIRSRLLEQFPDPQATLLAHVFVESHDELVTKAELNELTGVVHDLSGVVKELAESQKELAESQKELTESQQRTEARVEQLAEAQQRTEARVEELAEAQMELADAQKRTEFAVADLAKQVGGLANALGGSLKDFACDLVPEILEKHWRLVVASARPEEIAIGRKPREIDVVVRGTIDGRPVTVLCEVKSAVSVSEAKRFLDVVEKARAERPGDDVRPLFFGYRADRKARELIVASGAAMVFTRGVMIP